MMNRGRVPFVLAVGLMVFSRAPAFADDEGKVALNRVPAAARQAAAKAAPGVRFVEAYRDEDEGQEYFNLSGKDAQGRVIDVDVTPDGKVLALATQVRLRDVPKVVVDALRAKVPKLRLTLVQAVTKGGKVVEYAFDGTTPQDDELEVTVSADGSQVDIEGDDDDDGK